MACGNRGKEARNPKFINVPILECWLTQLKKLTQLKIKLMGGGGRGQSLENEFRRGMPSIRG